MERLRSWERVTATGNAIAERWRRLAEHHGLRIAVSGLPALIGFSFESERHLEYRTLVTQEMLQRGYLAATSVYVCIDHTEEVLDGYFGALDAVFATIRECEEGRDLASLLKGPVCHAGFRRLN
jgi:glutamate-1-semialdehyde 2,1-aminomutase